MLICYLTTLTVCAMEITRFLGVHIMKVFLTFCYLQWTLFFTLKLVSPNVFQILNDKSNINLWFNNLRCSYNYNNIKYLFLYTFLGNIFRGTGSKCSFRMQTNYAQFMINIFQKIIFKNSLRYTTYYIKQHRHFQKTSSWIKFWLK